MKIRRAGLCLILCFALGLVAWWAILGVTGKERPFDHNSYWGVMPVLCAVVGLFLARHAWMAGLAIMFPHLLLLAADIVRYEMVLWHRGVVVFVAFMTLCAVSAQIASLLRSLALGRPTPPGDAQP